jgi:hypothetical protein
VRPEGVCATEPKGHVLAALADGAEVASAEREMHALQRQLLCEPQLQSNRSLLLPQKRAHGRTGGSNAA